MPGCVTPPQRFRLHNGGLADTELRDCEQTPFEVCSLSKAFPLERFQNGCTHEVALARQLRVGRGDFRAVALGIAILESPYPG